MAGIKIHREQLPDYAGNIHIYSNDGQFIGTLEVTAQKSGTATSTLTYAPGQQPHRTYPLKGKYRAR